MPQSIFSILNQPVVYRADDDVTCKCGERENCLLITPGQQIYSQLKILPCGDFTVCNNTLGDELVLDGNFTKGDFSSWGTHDVNWAISAGRACSISAGTGTLAQNIAITAGHLYVITFTISGYDTGNLFADLGGTSLGGSPFSANGTYIQYVIAGAGGDIQFDANALTACIDNVSVREVISCWSADETTWTTSATGACHVAGNTTDLAYSSSSFVSGTYYHVTIVVSGSTAGGIKIILGTTILTPQTSGNGIFHFWGISNGTTLSVRPTSDFDGCISNLAVDKYCSDYKFHLIPASGDEYLVIDLTPYYTLTEDVFNLSNFSLTDQIPYGCYRLCLVDCCTEQQTAGSLLLNGNFTAGATHWTSQNVTFGGGFATFPSGFTLSFIEQALITTHNADCIQVDFDYAVEGFDTETLNIYINGVLVSSLSLSHSGSQTLTFGNVPAGAVIRFETISTLTNDIVLDNIVVTVPEQCQPIYDQCTPCINFQESFQCTKLVEGYCKGNALGFAFDAANGSNQFKLSLRVKAELLHPVYDQEQEDYDFSTGNTEISFGQSIKFESLTFYPIPAYKHSVLALEKICDTFQIDTIDYFCKKGNYTPEWNKNTSTDLAPSHIDVKKKDQTLYNTNC